MARIVRFLLLEDNENDATLIFNRIKEMDIAFEMEVAEGKDAYLGALESDKLPDVVLCDYQMPFYSGLSAYRDMKEKGFDLPFILITGTLSPDFAAEITKMGMDDYVVKDQLEKLVPIIKRHLVLNNLIPWPEQ